MEKLNMKTPDLTEKNILQLGAIFPEVITEIHDEQGNLTKGVDFDLLRQKLSSVLVEGTDERYRLDWPGKKASLVKANTPITKTLRPVIEESVDFENTQNLYIEGDNFEALKILQESYLGKVKMIYIDPPYNTGNDFIYDDKFVVDKDVYDESINAIDTEGRKLFRENNISNPRFHSDWLSMMNERLVLSRDLLSEDGIIFISIGENELVNLSKLCEEIFGEENIIGVISRVAKTASNKGTYFAPTIDYCVIYGKNITALPRFVDEVDASLYKKIETEIFRKGEYYRDDVALFQSSLDPMRGCKNQRYYIKDPDGNLLIPKGDNYPTEKIDAGFIAPKNPNDKVWRWTYEKYLKEKDLLVFKPTTKSPLVDQNGNQAKYNIYTKSYLNDRKVDGTLPRTLWNDFINRKGADLLKKINIPFDFSKPVELIEYMIRISNSLNCTILDFFSGSATTAHAIMRTNSADNGKRKFIMVQIPELTDSQSEAHKAGFKTIADIGKERIRRAGKKIKEESLADLRKQLAELDKKTQQGSLLEDEDSGQKKAEIEQKIKHIEALDIGFRVYKVDSSNMKDVYYHPSVVTQEQLSSFTSNIKEDRTAEDILTQVILDLGLELSLKIEKKKIRANDVFFVQENSLVACFDETIDFSIIDTIAQVKPLKVVFRDSGFKEDKDRINLAERFKRLSPETSIRVI